NPKSRRQAGRIVLPGIPRRIGPVYAAVVLLIEPRRGAGREDSLMNALPDFWKFVGQKISARVLVARNPGRSSIVAAENSRGRNRHKHPRRVGRIQNNRVNDQAASPGIPFWTSFVAIEPAHFRPRCASILAAEKASGVHTRIHHAGLTRAARTNVPNTFHRKPGILSVSHPALG